jgi:hypothetical protein
MKLLGFASALALASTVLATQAAATTYVGPSASYGSAVPAGDDSGNQRADYGYPLTYIFAGGAYTAPAAETIQPTEVNFVDQGAGSITPFIALYDGGTATAGSSYTLLAQGDAVAVSESDGGLESISFANSGVNPSVSLASGDIVVAGVYQTGQNVEFYSNSGPIALIWGGNDLPAIGNAFAGSPCCIYGADPGTYPADYRYDIGFNVTAVPEPFTWALMLMGFGGVGAMARARRKTEIAA